MNVYCLHGYCFVGCDACIYHAATLCNYQTTSQQTVGFVAIARGELSYLPPLGSEKIAAPYFKQRFFKGGLLPPRLSQTPRPPVPRQK